MVNDLKREQAIERVAKKLVEDEKYRRKIAAFVVDLTGAKDR